MNVKYYPVLFLLSLLAFVTKTAIAENSPSSWSFKGFGTLAASGTDTNKLGFYRDKSQTQDVSGAWGLTSDSRLGLQVDWKATDSLQATVQWVARDHAGNFFEQNLDWAFLRWSVQRDLDIRVGRLGTDSFMLSDYRNVGYAYPWMRPPHEFYANIPYYHFDGADITKKFSVGDGYLSVKVYGGYTVNQLPDEGTGLSKQKALLSGINLRYENGNWQARIGYNYSTITSKVAVQDDLLNFMNDPLLARFWPNLQQQLPSIFNLRGNQYHFSSVGVAYDDGIWLSQMEASYIASNTLWSPASAYLSVGRRFSKVTVYSLLGVIKTFHPNVNVSSPIDSSPELMGMEQPLNQIFNASGINERSVSLGARWDFHEKMALKTQWSHYWLNQNSLQHWQQQSDNPPNTVNVMSVGIDFIF
jgi:hypothetical protein